MRISLVPAPILAVLLLAVGIFAQQAAPPVVLKATTRLVQVNVIVQDGKGQPVTDLKKADFEIKVGGKLQPIRLFSVDSSTPLPQSTEKLPPSMFTNRMAVRAAVASGVTILLFDQRNTSLTDQPYAKAQVIKYLRTVHPEDHVGLYVLGSALRVLHDYTTDSTELLNRLATTRKGELPNLTDTEPTDAMQGDALVLDGMLNASATVTGAERDMYTEDRALATLRAFEFIAQHMAQLPGRKNLIWVSGGFPLDIGYDNGAAMRNPTREQRSFEPELQRTMTAVNDANMAIYPVDGRGLIGYPSANASQTRPPTPIGAKGKARRPPPTLPALVGVKNQQTMQEIADRTGGRAYYNTNDLAGAIREAIDDSRVTYTLGFYPTEEKFDKKFHEIKLDVVDRPGLKLRYRKGYFDLAEEPQDDKTRMTELHDAVWSPLDASALGLLAEIHPAPSKPGALEIHIKVDHAGISLEQQQDRWLGRLDILFVETDGAGVEYNGVSETINLHIGKENYDRLMKQDFIFQKILDRAEKARQLRVVVRDAASGAIGSVTIPLDKVS